MKDVRFMKQIKGVRGFNHWQTYSMNGQRHYIWD